MTLFAGENGSGKSTLVEAIAVAAGFNAEGGSRNMTVSTRASHSPLHEHIRLVKGSRSPRDGYFLRAESFFNVATHIEELDNLALMRRMYELTADGSQFVISTHSPILLGYPEARIFVLSSEGIVETSYHETEQYELTRSFLDDRDRFLHHLFADDEG